MKSVNYKDNKAVKNDITPLFLSAFPEDERPPVKYFFSSARKNSNNLYAYYDDNNEFIGFSYLSSYKDIIYVFFLAIQDEKRNRGLGSEILSKIKEENKGKVILLCYEEVDPKYNDNEMRIKRRNFYRRNGFEDNGVKTNEFGVVFETGYYGPHKVSFEDYVEIFVMGFSEYARKYIKEVK